MPASAIKEFLVKWPNTVLHICSALIIPHSPGSSKVSHSEIISLLSNCRWKLSDLPLAEENCCNRIAFVSPCTLKFPVLQFPSSQQKRFIRFQGLGLGWTGNVSKPPFTCREWGMGGWKRKLIGCKVMITILYHLMYVLNYWLNPFHNIHR